MEQFPELLVIKVSPQMAADIKRLAKADERTVSGYARRLLATALAERKDVVHERIQYEAPAEAR